jgi:hypothetical protein
VTVEVGHRRAGDVKGLGVDLNGKGIVIEEVEIENPAVGGAADLG